MRPGTRDAKHFLSEAAATMAGPARARGKRRRDEPNQQPVCVNGPWKDRQAIGDWQCWVWSFPVFIQASCCSKTTSDRSQRHCAEADRGSVGCSLKNPTAPHPECNTAKAPLSGQPETSHSPMAALGDTTWSPEQLRVQRVAVPATSERSRPSLPGYRLESVGFARVRTFAIRPKTLPIGTQKVARHWRH